MLPAFVAKAMLALALAQPGPYVPPRAPVEPAASRAERIGWIVGAAIEASTSEEAAGWPWSSEDLAVAALVTTYYEGHRWSLAVHRAPWSPDVKGRAACMGQLHQTVMVPYREWLTLGGDTPEATRRCLHAVVRVLSRHAARCRVGSVFNEWQAARILSAYGRGGCSRKPLRWAPDRAWRWSRWRRLVALPPG